MHAGDAAEGSRTRAGAGGPGGARDALGGPVTGVAKKGHDSKGHARRTAGPSPRVDASPSCGDPSVASVDEVNKLVRSNPVAGRDYTSGGRLYTTLLKFVESNEDISDSPNLKLLTVADDTSCLFMLLGDCLEVPTFAALVLRVMKILFRKEVNRQRIVRKGVDVVLSHLRSPPSPKVALEGSNVVLNMCYTKGVVDLVVDQGGVPPLTELLLHRDSAVQGSAAGALQSICFQPLGRLAAREAGAIPALVKLLETSDQRVLERVVGALHNISSDMKSAELLLAEDKVSFFLTLFDRPSSKLCGSAAGVLQNLSRESAGRDIIRGTAAVELMTPLLFSSDTTVQTCVAGALLNLLSDDRGGPGSTRQRTLKRVLADAIALGQLSSVTRESATFEYS